MTEINQARENWNQTKGGNNLVVSEQDIAHIVASWTGVPVQKIAQEESEKLLNREGVLQPIVVGQDDPVKAFPQL